MCVAVLGELIAFVGSLAELPAELARLNRVDYGDATIMPGLIDAHVHIEFDPRYGLHDQPELSVSQHDRQMQVRAAAMARHGITTARDLGGRGGAFRLREQIRSGACIGPRLLVAGQAVTRPGGHCHQWGGAAKDETEMVKVIQRQVANSADLIKVMATGGVRTAGTNPAQSAFTSKEMRIAVACAAAAGLRVAAHAHGVHGIRACADAKVGTVEHCSWVDERGRWGCVDRKCAAALAQAGTFVCPTVPASWGQSRFQGLKQTMGAAYRVMLSAGVRFAAGTDSGAIPNVWHHQLLDGLLVFGDAAEMSAAQLLRCATSEAAAACALEATTGMLTDGYAADLLVVPGNPLRPAHPQADFFEELERSLRHPLAVVCRGMHIEPCQPPASSYPAWTASGDVRACACTLTARGQAPST